MWYGLTTTEINNLEDLDRTLLRKILKAPITAPKESFYLELGLVPLGIVIKSRRINYFHYLLTRNKNEMLYKFFITQWFNPTKGDWTETVREDLSDFGMSPDIEYYEKGKYSIKNEVKK